MNRQLRLKHHRERGKLITPDRVSCAERAPIPATFNWVEAERGDGPGLRRAAGRSRAGALYISDLVEAAIGADREIVRDLPPASAAPAGQL